MFIVVSFFPFQIREGRQQDVGSCLIREYRMLCHALKGELNKDFVEVEYVNLSAIHFTALQNS